MVKAQRVTMWTTEPRILLHTLGQLPMPSCALSRGRCGVAMALILSRGTPWEWVSFRTAHDCGNPSFLFVDANETREDFRGVAVRSRPTLWPEVQMAMLTLVGVNDWDQEAVYGDNERRVLPTELPRAVIEAVRSWDWDDLRW